MTAKTTIRQDIWQAAVAVLEGEFPQERAYDLANKIVDRYSGKRREVSNTYKVSAETEQKVKRLLLARELGMNKIAKEAGVGTSTVQRLANELIEQGLLPQTR